MSTREALLDRLVQAAERDERVLAVIEGGSAVVGEVDEFSDVDVLVVCTVEGQESLLDEARGGSLRGWGPSCRLSAVSTSVSRGCSSVSTVRRSSTSI